MSAHARVVDSVVSAVDSVVSAVDSVVSAHALSMVSLRMLCVVCDAVLPKLRVVFSAHAHSSLP